MSSSDPPEASPSKKFIDKMTKAINKVVKGRNHSFLRKGLGLFQKRKKTNQFQVVRRVLIKNPQRPGLGLLEI